MKAMRWIMATLALSLVFGCEKSDSGSGADVSGSAEVLESDDTSTASDATISSDADVAVNPDECPKGTSYDVADGTACPTDGVQCSSPGCSDPCQHCNILTCQQGKWQHMEAFPVPNCDGDVLDSDVLDDSDDAQIADVSGEDTQEPCPDPGTAEGTACGSPGQSCGECGNDPCQFCNILRCEGGVWTHLEAFPDPNCGADTQDSDVDPCEGTGCAEAPMCDDGCTVECGCCGCVKGQSHCVDNAGTAAVRTCSSLACYVDNPCAKDDFCIEGGPDAGIGCIGGFGTCEGIVSAYAWITGQGQPKCKAATECEVLQGQCAVGLGGCYEVVHESVNQALLDALGARFNELGCTSGVCKCAAPPTDAKCVDGACVPVTP